MDLFTQITKRLNGHSRTPLSAKRRRRELFPLTPVCAHRGGAYTGGRLAKTQGGTRGYVHAKPKARMDAAARQRFDDMGCKTWYVDAAELEEKIKRLIVDQRSSVEFESELRNVILERDSFRDVADQALEQAKAEVTKCENAYRRLSRIAAAVSSEQSEDKDDALVQQLTDAKNAVKAAKDRQLEAEAFVESRASAWERLSKIIHETRNIAAAWKKATPEDRKVLLDYWVLDVLVVVEPIPGKRRANQKTALVYLRNAPNTPLQFDLGADQPSKCASDARMASRTDSSASSSKRSRKRAAATQPPTPPSAQAACARASGSSSSSAADKTSTSASDPAFPSTTAALRFKPRSLARFIGEPLNATENSEADISSNSRDSVRASLSATAGLAAKEGTDIGRENLWLYGHTS